MTDNNMPKINSDADIPVLDVEDEAPDEAAETVPEPQNYLVIGLNPNGQFFYDPGSLPAAVQRLLLEHAKNEISFYTALGDIAAHEAAAHEAAGHDAAGHDVGG